VRAFRSEKQNHWLEALEEGFRHWGGVPQEVLMDNARALVSQHDPEREILVFAQRLEAFARYWDFKPRACRPYRARTKGKDERGVAYVKKNAIAGREFDSWAELEAHLVRWTREVADLRVHGTTGEVRWSDSCGRKPRRYSRWRPSRRSWRSRSWCGSCTATAA
jgi:transposase